MEAPHLNALYEKFKNRGFTVLAVNSWNEDADLMRKFARINKLGYPMLLNGLATTDAWGVTGLPDNFLVDRSGKIVAKHLTINDKTLARVESKIEKLLE
mgnify:CR=1 FL=1